MTSTPLIEKCCLVANPVAGNPTHYIIEHALAQAGLDWRFMTFEVVPARLGEAIAGLRALGFHGVKIAEPFQTAAIEHIDELTERAKRCGSVNTLTAQGERLVGDNTEGAALVNLASAQVALDGAPVTILGAGRLARAIAVTLAEAGAASITLATRSPEAGQRLVGELQGIIETPLSLVLLESKPLAIDAGMALVVNATSLGMREPSAKLALDPASLLPAMVVADVAYNTSHTWLTRQGAGRGARVIDGLAIYVEQTALALKDWTNVEPDRIAMREAAEEFLGI